MENDVLDAHYERKYSHESTATESDPLKVVEHPTTRCEAAVKFFPKFFRGGSILELGAGDGRVAKTLLLSNPDIRSYSLADISLPRLSGIMRNIRDYRVSAIPMNAEAVPIEEQEKYDAIIMIALIEHLVDPLGAMAQIRLLLKLGGFVYIDTPNIAKYTRRMKLLLGEFPSTASRNEGLTTYDDQPTDLHDEGHLHYFTYRSLSAMLMGRCGFSKIEKLAYPCGKLILGKKVEGHLARMWPEAFSDVVVIAYR